MEHAVGVEVSEGRCEFHEPPAHESLRYRLRAPCVAAHHICEGPARSVPATWHQGRCE